MKIRDVLSPTDIIVDVRASDKARLLRHLSAQAASELGLDPVEVSNLIAEREELGSTGVGNGVALPSALSLIAKPCFGRSPSSARLSSQQQIPGHHEANRQQNRANKREHRNRRQSEALTMKDAAQPLRCVFGLRLRKTVLLECRHSAYSPVTFRAWCQSAIPSRSTTNSALFVSPSSPKCNFGDAQCHINSIYGTNCL